MHAADATAVPYISPQPWHACHAACVCIPARNISTARHLHRARTCPGMCVRMAESSCQQHLSVDEWRRRRAAIGGGALQRKQLV